MQSLQVRPLWPMYTALQFGAEQVARYTTWLIGRECVLKGGSLRWGECRKRVDCQNYEECEGDDEKRSREAAGTPIFPSFEGRREGVRLWVRIEDLGSHWHQAEYYSCTHIFHNFDYRSAFFEEKVKFVCLLHNRFPVVSMELQIFRFIFSFLVVELRAVCFYNL